MSGPERAAAVARGVRDFIEQHDGLDCVVMDAIALPGARGDGEE